MEVGEALIFDDPIEHEAHNHSDKLRVVLLFKLWHQQLTAMQRDMVNTSIRGGAGA